MAQKTHIIIRIARGKKTVLLAAGEGLNTAAIEVQGKFATFEISLLCCAVCAVLMNCNGAFLVWYRLVFCRLFTSFVWACQLPYHANLPE